MIVVDTSALMAIVLDEPEAEDCGRALDTDDELLVSAGTLAEALVVADRRGVGKVMRLLVEQLSLVTVPLGAPDAFHVADAYARWGKGVHPAGLNLGDCFAYALAQARNAPLAFVGGDFGRTDVRRALPTSGAPARPDASRTRPDRAKRRS